MKGRITLALSLCAGCLPVLSQSPHVVTPVTQLCGTYSQEQKLWAEHPEWKVTHEEELAAFNDYVAEFAQSWSPDDRAFYVIPTVVHVIHFGGDENISDDQIYDAIKQLNEDYSATNEDVVETINPWDVLVEDMNVEFRLAGLDIDSNCTKGITRTYSNLTFGGSATAVADLVQSVHGNWPQNRYMNIFVMADLLGPAGYSFFPGSWYAANSMYGGVYIRSDYMGSIGTSDVEKEHQLGHEVGHWLNLEHLWGGDSDNPGLPANCGGTDWVSDTPPTIGHSDCPLSDVTCSDPDILQNFMELSPCRCMFTTGQATRVSGCLNTSMAQRNMLWNGTNLTNTGVDGSILCAADFDADQVLACVGATITFDDKSYHTADSWFWNFEGGTPNWSTDENPVIQYFTPGHYNVTLQATNGAAVETLIRWQYITIFDTIGAPPLPFEQDFEDLGSPFDYNAFGLYNENDEEAWKISPIYGYMSNKSAWLQNLDTEDGSIDELISETINLDGIGDEEEVHFQFDYSYIKESIDDEEYLRVYFSYDCGETWILRLTLDSDEMSDTYMSGPYFPVEDEWWTVGQVVPGITDEFKVHNFMFKFQFQNGGGNNIFIDNINIFPADWLDIEEDERDEAIKIYPNPAESFVNVIFDQGIEYNYTLSDMSGKIISRNRLSPQIEVSDLAAGMYVVEITDDQQAVVRTQRIAVR